MRKGLLYGLTCLLLFFSVPIGASAAAAAEGSAEVVATVSLREGPSTSRDVIRYLKKGETVALLDEYNAYWYQVRDSRGTIGYVSSSEKYLNVTRPIQEERLGGSNAVVVSTVNFRTGPSTGADRIRYLKPGEEIVITGAPSANWYAATDAGGVSGFVSSSEQYIRVTGPLPEPEPADVSNAVVVSTVSFRKAPSTSGERMRYLQKGEKIAVTAQVNSYWYAVTDSKGVSGYVSSSTQYVQLTGPIPTPELPTGSEAVELVIAAGLKYWGVPYEFGSDRSTTTTFDCSDFVRQAFKDALGLTLPTDSRKQGAYVLGKGNVSTDLGALKRGDLLFFMDYHGTKPTESAYLNKNPFETRISHVGIYLGNGEILHTYSVSSGGVRIDRIFGTHWEYRFLFGGSAL